MSQRIAALAGALFFAAAIGCSKDGAGGPGSNGDGGPGSGDGGPGSNGDGGPGSGDGGQGLPPGTTALRIDPPSAQLVTDGVTAARQAFDVIAMKQDGSTENVSGRATFIVAPGSLGAMSGATFTSALAGGRGKLTAMLGTLSAEAAITVELHRVANIPPGGGQPALPSNPGGIFQGAPADPGRAPQLLYPNDGVLLPPNLGVVEVHYRPGSPSNSLFELSFTTAIASITAYTRCTPLADGCVFVLGAELWASLAATEGGGDPIAVRVRGTDDAGSGAGTSNEVHMNIAAFPVQGGLYYWTTSNGTAIMRVDFGSAQQTPDRFFPFQGGGCFGCHALARNGQRMTLSENGQNDGRMFLIDVASQNILLSPDMDQREQFQSWNPTSDRFAGIYGDNDPPDTNIRIRSGDDGRVLETIAAGNEVSHPDWSPRGDRIAFTWVTHHQTSQRPGRGGISYVQQSAGGTGWSTPMALIPPEDGKNRYYPAYAPDARFLIYDESTCPPGQTYDGSCDADADESAKFFAMLADGGPAIELMQANAPGLADQGRTELSNSFPKWAPFTDPRTRDGNGKVMWFTFSSRRQYGLRAPGGSNLLLWMAAVDPDAIVAGHDGSYAAFALPFQDLDTSNHIAQWTTRIVPSSPDGGIGGGGGDGGVDPGGPGGSCLAAGDPCDPNHNLCCSTSICSENGPGIYLCRPNL